MTTPNPSEQLASDLSALQGRVDSLQKGVRLTNTRDAVEDLQTTVNNLSQRVSDLRTRGYVFGKDMETRSAGFVSQWGSIAPAITSAINQQAANLELALRPLETQITQLTAQINNPTTRSLTDKLQNDVSTLENNVSAAEQEIGGMYDSFSNEVHALTAQIDKIDWTLNQLAEASFQLIATEAGVMAVKAVWIRAGREQKGDPEGVLYLTDQRLIFEQKEEVATKKVLFIATEKEKVQKLELETPVTLIESVTTSKLGMFKNEDHLEFRFASGAPVVTAHFHIWQPCEEWQALINRAKSKDFDNDRAVAVDAAVIAKTKAAPSQCPSCGGIINQVILRGQDSIKCEFCGFVIRL